MKNSKEESVMLRKFFRPVLWGTAIGSLCCLLLLLVAAAVMAAQDIPQIAVTPLAVIAAAAGSLIGGVIAGRIVHEKGLLLGATCGLFLFAIIMIAGFSMLREVRGSYLLVKLLVMLACGAVGGVVGVNLKKRR